MTRRIIIFRLSKESFTAIVQFLQRSLDEFFKIIRALGKKSIRLLIKLKNEINILSTSLQSESRTLNS